MNELFSKHESLQIFAGIGTPQLILWIPAVLTNFEMTLVKHWRNIYVRILLESLLRAFVKIRKHIIQKYFRSSTT